MKKIGLILSLCLVMVVGGVYATFNYAQGGVQNQNGDVTVSIDGAVTTTEKGTITVSGNPIIELDDTDNDLVVDMTISESLSVSFTANSGADASVAENGIELKLVLSIDGTNLYNQTEIFKLKDAYTEGGVSLGIVKDGTTINLSDYVEINTISLPTYADYTEFAAIVNGSNAPKITYTITEA